MARSRKHYYFQVPLTALKALPHMADDPKNLYLALCSRANFKSGICWPSYRTIMEDTRISNGKRVKAAIDVLVELGYINTWLVGQCRWYEVKKRID